MGQCGLSMNCQLLLGCLLAEQRDHGCLGPILLAVLAGLLGCQTIGDIVEQLEGQAQFVGKALQVGRRPRPA